MISPPRPGRQDGVGDYSYWLALSLSEQLEVTLVNEGEESGSSAGEGMAAGRKIIFCSVGGWRELWRRRSEPALSGEAVLFQYVPQLYFPRADLLWLLLWLARGRFRRSKIFVTVHEYNVPWKFAARRAAVHISLNLLAVVLALLSTRVIVTHETYRRKLSRLLFFKRNGINLIPVSTNIPDENRAQDGLVEGAARRAAPVLTLFGQPSAMEKELLSFLGQRISSGQVDLRVRWLGRSREEIVNFWCGECGLPAGSVEVYEKLPDAEVGRVLSESDVFLAPLVDGVSTRRTTVVAALSRGLPVVGTRGACTDDSLARSPAFLLCETWDKAAFLRHIQLLCVDSARRAEMGREARTLFMDRFSWEKVSREYLRLLQS